MIKMPSLRWMLGIMMIHFALNAKAQYLLPIQSPNREDIRSAELTEIGAFGLLRKARPEVAAHYHTGIDLKRPKPNYQQEPIFPVAEGRVISVRNDGPFAQIIIEHPQANPPFWTVYEHIAEIQVQVGEWVQPQQTIARFMNREELYRYGWQFDHVHLEILKIKPQALQATDRHPQRFFASYTLQCLHPADLEKYFYDPLVFMSK